jgi:hypothetical protein
MKIVQQIVLISCALLIFYINSRLPEKWGSLSSVITSRLTQTKNKMKLTHHDVSDIENLLNSLTDGVSSLSKLQYLLPKTTVELLRSVAQRNVSIEEADAMAQYLQQMTRTFNFENVPSFDENTSHIIGREWHEIDYSGENLTWQKQQKHYAQYGIENFKSPEMLKKFFAVESKYSYFTKVYKPHGSPFTE